jgi:hypothetical protein
MRKWIVSAAVAAGVAAAALLGGGAAAGAASASPAELARGEAKPGPRVCRTVRKVVRGKRRTVRVCTKKTRKKAPTTAKNVSLVLEQSRAASATIGRDGGTVTAAAANGARVSIAVPAGALADETPVTVTPVARLGGAAGIRVLAGVEFGPDGTVLGKPATVSFELPRAATRAFGVAWFGDGQNLHRYSFAGGGTRATFKVVHFSGVAVVQGDPDLLPRLETALTIAYAREVRPLLRQATTDDALFTPAVDAGFRWIKATELTSLAERFKTWRAEAQELLRQVFAHALDKASERCVNHDLTQIDRIFKISQKAETMQWDLPGLTGFDRVRRCARFELEMSLDWTGSLEYANSGGSQTIRDALTVRATRVPLEMTGELSRIEGAGSLEPTAWHEMFVVSTPDYSCTVESNGAATPKEPLQATLAFDASKLSSSPPEIFLTIDPGDVTTPREGGCGSADNPDPEVYRGAWATMYAAEKRPDGRFTVRMTSYVGGDVFARFGPDARSGTASAGFDIRYSGTLTLTLRHTPQR